MDDNCTPLNVLFAQNSPCIRNYKMAAALRSRGHRVSLAYMEDPPSQILPQLSEDHYNDCIRITEYRHLWDISGNYDLIHCHNKSDILSVAALAGDAPLIHDTDELISLQDRQGPGLSFFEGVANQGADGRVYRNQHQMEEARKRYGVTGPSIVFGNFASDGNEIDHLIAFYHSILNSDYKPHPQNQHSSALVSSNSKSREPLNRSKPVRLKAKIESAILDLDAWLGQNGWAGYDPYDVKEFLLHRRINGEVSQAQIEHIIRLDENQPGEVRKDLQIQPRINAKAMALFLNSYAQLRHLMEGKEFSYQISSCSDWLLENASKNIEGLGWGYPFDWESVVIIPAGTPTSVNSYHAGDAFWELYQQEEKAQWLEICVKVAEFFINDLNRDQIDSERICFSYTPLDFFHVHNANLCVAEFLVRVGIEIERTEFIDLGLKAVQFALSDFPEDGFLTYWAKGYEPTPSNRGQFDHYHSAAELRSLFRLCGLLPDRSDIRAAFERYFEFYLTYFFEDGRIPKIHPRSVYPINIHAAAEAAYILGETANFYPEAMSTLSKFLEWFLSNCINSDGSFIYLISQSEGEERVNPFPFVRWGQAWTLRGLTSALKAITAMETNCVSIPVSEADTVTY